MKLNLVPASTGITWVKLGIRTFFRQPLALAALFFMYMSMIVVAQLIPWVGGIIAVLITPAAQLGFMVAVHEIVNARFPMPTVLIAAFRAGREQLRAMLVLGVLFAVASTAVMLVAMVFMPEAPKVEPATQEAQLAMMRQMAPAVLLMLALYMPVSMLFWHAPALVYFHGIPPVKSLFFSLVACIRNWAALTVFALAWFGFVMLAFIPISLVMSLAGTPQAAAPFLVPVVMIFVAMFSTSIYFTFRDSFTADTPPTPNPTPASIPGETP